MKNINEIRRGRHGPGGLKCPCCCEFPKRKAKAKDARHVRRKDRQEIRKAIGKENL